MRRCSASGHLVEVELAGRDAARPRRFPELEQLNDRGPQTGEALAATLDLDRRQG